MKLENIISRIDELKDEVDALRPMKPEQLSRWLQKVRLDWTYHSNKMEGNTLTYGETKNLLLFGNTAQGKPLRHHEEIKGHNVVVDFILNFISGNELEITEVFIRNFHKIIIPKEYKVNAKTADGQPTSKTIVPGRYKALPNHVETVTGEIFHFAEPIDTPIKMKELIDWYNHAESESKLHPLLLASQFHYKFVRIHPFDDGNGRMSRILMNIILMKHGYPPVIIDTEKKDEYFEALHNADLDDSRIDSFILFVGQRLIEALELWLRAARGEQLEDISDIDKRIAQLQTRIDSLDKPTTLDLTVLENTYNNNLKDFIIQLATSIKKYSKFFMKFIISLKIDNEKEEPYAGDIFSDYKWVLNRLEGKINTDKMIKNIEITFNFSEFIKKKIKELALNTSVNIQLTQHFFQIIPSCNQQLILQAGYGAKLNQEEVDIFILKMASYFEYEIEKHIQEIEQYIKNNRLEINGND